MNGQLSARPIAPMATEVIMISVKNQFKLIRPIQDVNIVLLQQILINEWLVLQKLLRGFQKLQTLIHSNKMNMIFFFFMLTYIFGEYERMFMTAK